MIIAATVKRGGRAELVADSDGKRIVVKAAGKLPTVFSKYTDARRNDATSHSPLGVFKHRFRDQIQTSASFGHREQRQRSTNRKGRSSLELRK